MTPSLLPLCIRSVAVVLLAGGLTVFAGQKPDTQGFFEQHCLDCHDADAKKGGVDLDSLKWSPEDTANAELWIKVYDLVEQGTMPPKKKERPAESSRHALLKSLGDSLLGHERQQVVAEGRTKLRRLNRHEYERTVHDLLKIDIPLKDMLPADPAMHGFDTVSDGLRLSTMQIESYLEAADAAITAAIRLDPGPKPIKARLHIKDEAGVRKILDTPEGQLQNPNDPASKHKLLLRELKETGAVVFFDQNYPMAHFPKLGTFPGAQYRIRVSAYAFQSQGKNIPMRIYGDDYKVKNLLGWFDMPPDKPRVVEVVTTMRNNEHIRIQPVNTGRDENGKDVYSVSAREFGAPGLALQWMEIEGPLNMEWPLPSMKALLGDTPVLKIEPGRKGKVWNIDYEVKPADPKGSLKDVLEGFAGRAFRRPLIAGELDPYVQLAQAALDDGQPFLEAVRAGVRAVLTAPQFLFLEERPGKLSDYALASRLSYFLWSTMPDETLLTLAKEGRLSQPEVLKQQTERMLKDPRSQGLVKNFTGQWLNLRHIDATSPDTKLYPEHDELLRACMLEETESFFRELLTSDLPATNVVDSDFAMLNSRLAVHYGIPGVEGEAMRKVMLPADSPRGGFLTQASVLKVTANGTTTSPVVRGAWVLKNILGQPPTPPPPGVGSIEPDTRGATTVRQQLALHRKMESCASCHSSLDPPGFALESFDVIGGFRDRYRSQDKGDSTVVTNTDRRKLYIKLGPAVDASGALPDGRAFQDIRTYKKLLLQDSDRITENLASKLIIYATGARIGFSDRAEVRSTIARASKNGGGLRSLICEIVQSPLFQNK